MNAQRRSWLIRSAFGALLLVAPFVLTTFRTRLLAEILIFAIFALSLNVLLGFTGMPSIGHAAVFGAGGYAAGLLAVHVTSQLLAGIVAGVVAGVALAVITGPFVIRTTGVYFIMLTLAIAELFRSWVERARTITGGDEGVSGIPAPQLFGEVTISASATPVRFYLYILAAFALTYGLIVRLRHSSLGHTLVGIRENAPRMRALGYPVTRYRMVAYVIAGGLAGFAGALYTQLNRFMAPDLVGFTMSALVIMMVILGGAYTVYGPVLGAGAVIVIREAVSLRFDHWEIALGLAFMLIIYLMPRGIGGVVERFGLRAAGESDLDRSVETVEGSTTMEVERGP